MPEAKKAGLSEADYASRIEALIGSRHLGRGPVGTPADWANESHRLAIAAWLDNGAKIDQAYFDREIPVVDGRESSGPDSGSSSSGCPFPSASGCSAGRIPQRGSAYNWRSNLDRRLIR